MMHFDSLDPNRTPAVAPDPFEAKPDTADVQAAAEWTDAIRAEPPISLPVIEPSLSAPEKPSPALAYAVHVLWGWVLPAAFFLSIVILALYAAPFLLSHWRLAEAQVEAEATYLKRRAELKADAEHADERLDLLDKRVHLASLGFREVVRKVAPNVVNIVNLREPKKNDLFQKRTLFFDPDTDRKYAQQGVGSGILVKPGYVLTNFHVVREAQRLRVTFASGHSLGLDPDAVATDPITDLAVIRLPADPPVAPPPWGVGVFAS